MLTVEGDADVVLALLLRVVLDSVRAIAVVDGGRRKEPAAGGADLNGELVATNGNATTSAVASLNGELSVVAGLVARLETLTVGQALTRDLRQIPIKNESKTL